MEKGMNWADLVEYKDGKLYWLKTSKNGKAQAGERGGSWNNKGYRRIKHQGQNIAEHRLIWELLKGPIPGDLTIDHINGIRDDNRIENLRLLPHSKNASLGARGNRNPALPYGVCKDGHRFRARVGRGGERIALGFYDTPEEAGAAVQAFVAAE